MVTQVAASGRPQKSVVFELATTGTGPVDKRWEKHASSVTFTPSSDTDSWQGLTPDAQVKSMGEPTWELSATLIQAYNDPNSLARFLIENYGKTATVTYYPHDDVSWGIQTTITLPAPVVGGGPSINEATVTAACTKPVILTTAAPAAT